MALGSDGGRKDKSEVGKKIKEKGGGDQILCLMMFIGRSGVVIAPVNYHYAVTGRQTSVWHNNKSTLSMIETNRIRHIF